jgi:hypothetical protein
MKHDIKNLAERMKINFYWGVTYSVNNHNLTDQQKTSNCHRAGQKNIRYKTNEQSVSHAVREVSFEIGNIVFVIRPLSKIVKARIEKAVCDNKHPRRESLIEESDEYDDGIHRSIVNHLKNKALYLTRNASQYARSLDDI